MQVGEEYNPRNIFTGIFIPVELLRTGILSPGALILFGRLALHLNEKNGGCFPFVETLSAELAASIDQITRWMRELVSAGFIKRIRTGTGGPARCVFLWHATLESSLKSYKPTSPEPAKIPVQTSPEPAKIPVQTSPEPAKIPVQTSPEPAKIPVHYIGVKDSIEKNNAHAVCEPKLNGSHAGQKVSKSKGARKTADRSGSPERWFEDDFWPLYPRKVGKGQARKAFLAHIQTEDLKIRVITALRGQLDELMESGMKYCPYPATWLNGERWDDDQHGATHATSTYLPAEDDE